MRDFSSRLLSLSPLHIVGSLCCLIIQSLFVSRRWMGILKCTSRLLPYRQILVTHYLSLSSSLILPNIVAEPAVKAFLLRKYKVPVSEAIASVIIDKLFVLIGLFALTLLVSPLIFTMYPQTQGWLYTYVITLIVLISGQFLTRVFGIFYGKMKKLREKYQNYLEIARQLFFDEKLMLPSLLLSFASQFFAICGLYILSLSTAPELAFYQCLLLMPPVMLATAMPVAFNGWGIREVAMIYVLGFVSIPSEAAFALSVQFGSIGLLLWSIGLIFWIPVKRGKNEGT